MFSEAVINFFYCSIVCIKTMDIKNNNICFRVLCCRVCFLQQGISGHVIGVHKIQVFTCGTIDPPVSLYRSPLIFSEKHFDPRIQTGIQGQNIFTVIG